jgi:hypothetical protein
MPRRAVVTDAGFHRRSTASIMGKR